MKVSLVRYHVDLETQVSLLFCSQTKDNNESRSTLLHPFTAYTHYTQTSTKAPPTMSLSMTTNFARRFAAVPSVQRGFSTSTLLRKAQPPSANPPAADQAGRTTHVSTDATSSASKDEHLTGTDHPAKRSDRQAPSERSTGFKEGTKEVKGDKEGEGL